MVWDTLKEAVEYETYEQYCASRRDVGLGVVPEPLFNTLTMSRKKQRFDPPADEFEV